MNVACGNCGGPVFMATCDHFRGSGHEWVIVSICLLCRLTTWTKDGCHDCTEHRKCPDCGKRVLTAREARTLTVDLRTICTCDVLRANGTPENHSPGIEVFGQRVCRHPELKCAGSCRADYACND